ncbi:TetR/AcrR family transcriptional regulator [Citricoccus nitrophenolicus]|uniref:TetR family transcriptional regulator n=1 Tax=Citricoccus muralis TaxID=169134 RepID=A0A3D9LCY3_9MICC|nr:TetR/AcrR family transcriptional regulator [Citricoccus muralis]REE03534.1 TetR family transcriptional regulator [Citricoccus muralis]
MSTSPVRQSRLPREERRKQLLDAARQVFVDHGFHATSMDDIAVAAAVSKPVLYQHFPGKHELFLDLMDTQVDLLGSAITAALESTTDNKARVQATIHAYFQFVDSPDRAYRLLFDSGLNNDPDVALRMEGLDHRFAADIAEVIAADTTLSREEALLLGHGLAGLVNSSARHWAGQSGDDSRPDLETAADLAFRLAWRGISRFPKER